MSNMLTTGTSSSPRPILESPLYTLEQLVDSFIAFTLAQTFDDELHFSETVAHMHALLASARRCEKAGVARSDILEVIGAVRDVVGSLPYQKTCAEFPVDATAIDLLLSQAEQPATQGDLKAARTLYERALSYALELNTPDLTSRVCRSVTSIGFESPIRSTCQEVAEHLGGLTNVVD